MLPVCIIHIGGQTATYKHIFLRREGWRPKGVGHFFHLIRSAHTNDRDNVFVPVHHEADAGLCRTSVRAGASYHRRCRVFHG
jgi:hypothetical protein